MRNCCVASTAALLLPVCSSLCKRTKLHSPMRRADDGLDATESTAIPETETLTRQEAEQLALKNNPGVSVAVLIALAQKQVTRETRAGELPGINGNGTAVGAEEASRLSALGLTSSRLLNHVGAGVELSQLITDFGRTHNLIASSSLQASAAEQNAEATREDIVFAADLAFYNALEAQATLQVAESTVKERQNVADQIDALTSSKLKSTLDQSFAHVTLSQARLLVLDSQNQENAAMAGSERYTRNHERYALPSGRRRSYAYTTGGLCPEPHSPRASTTARSQGATTHASSRCPLQPCST